MLTRKDKLNAYSTTLDGGGFRPKDFRTMKGTSMATDLIKQMPPPKNEKQYKQRVKAVAEKVSRVLGNRPQQAVKSYIDPIVWSLWRASAHG